MAAIDDLKRFYAGCMGCKNSSKECPSISEDKIINPVPRGFYFESPQIKILAVTKNAGHAKKNEPQRYKGKKGRLLVKAHLKFVKELFVSGTYKFHRNLLYDLKMIVGLPLDLDNRRAVEEVFSKVAYTNLVKCSTENASLHLRHYCTAANNCFDRFLAKEVRLFNPKIILAFGREAEWFLKKHNKLDQLGLPNKCIFYVVHPSARGRAVISKEESNDIRKKLEMRARSNQSLIAKETY